MANAREVGGVEEIIGLLGKDEGETRACEAVDRLAQAGRWQELALLARALESRSNSAKLEAFELVADHVEDQLALCTGPDAVDAVFALASEPREKSVSVARSKEVRLRAFGSRLGFGQEVSEFFAALERHSGKAEHRELLACWMQEIVLRGTSFEGHPQAEAFRRALAGAGHPLANLPLVLLPAEREVPSYMPLYGDKGLGRALDALTSGTISVRTIPPPGEGAPLAVTAVEDAGVQARLRVAVRPWAEGSHGKVEATVFSLPRKIERRDLGRWLLRALPLESTAAASGLEVSSTGAEGVFGPLFSAASNGGASSSGLGGAYGRLAAWTSLGALVGAPENAGVDAIAALAATSGFLVFSAKGPWFHDVAWDLGALALRSDGRSAAVLAATDAE
jgi:hypothetical protein